MLQATLQPYPQRTSSHPLLEQTAAGEISASAVPTSVRIRATASAAVAVQRISSSTKPAAAVRDGHVCLAADLL